MMRDIKRGLKPRKHRSPCKSPFTPKTTLTVAHNLSTSISIIDFDNFHDESEAGCQKYIDDFHSFHKKTVIYSDKYNTSPSTSPNNKRLFESRRIQVDSDKPLKNYYTYDEIRKLRTNYVEDNSEDCVGCLPHSSPVEKPANTQSIRRQVVSYPDVNVHVISMMISHLKSSLTANRDVTRNTKEKQNFNSTPIEKELGHTDVGEEIQSREASENEKNVVTEHPEMFTDTEKHKHSRGSSNNTTLHNSTISKFGENRPFDVIRDKIKSKVAQNTNRRCHYSNSRTSETNTATKDWITQNQDPESWKSISRGHDLPGSKLDISETKDLQCNNKISEKKLDKLGNKNDENGTRSAKKTINILEPYQEAFLNKELKTIWKSNSSDFNGKSINFKASPRIHKASRHSQNATLLKQMKSFLNTSSAKNIPLSSFSAERSSTINKSSSRSMLDSQSLLEKIGDSNRQKKLRVLLMKKSLKSSCSEIACNIELLACRGNRRMHIEPRVEEIYINEKTKISKHRRRHHKEKCRIIEHECIKRPLTVSSAPNPGMRSMSWIPKVVKKVQNCFCYVKDIIRDTTYEISEKESENTENHVKSTSDYSTTKSTVLSYSSNESNPRYEYNEFIGRDNIITLFCNSNISSSSTNYESFIKNGPSNNSKCTLHNPFSRKYQVYMANYIPFIPRALSDIKFPIHMKNQISMIKYRDSLDEQFSYLKDIANSIMVLIKVLKNIYNNDYDAISTYSKCITSIFRIKEICHSVTSVNLPNNQNYYSETGVEKHKIQNQNSYFKPIQLETVREETLKVNQTFPVLHGKTTKNNPVFRLEKTKLISISSNKILLQWKMSESMRKIICYYKVYVNNKFQCTRMYFETCAILENVNMSEPMYITILTYTVDGYCFSAELKAFVS